MNLSEKDQAFVQEISVFSGLRDLSQRDSELEQLFKINGGLISSYCNQVVKGQATKLMCLIEFVTDPYARIALLNMHKDFLHVDCHASYSLFVKATLNQFPANSVVNNGNILALLCGVFKLFYKATERDRVLFVSTTKSFLSKMRDVYSLTPIHWLFAQACNDLNMPDVAVAGLEGYFPLKIEKEVREIAATYQNFLSYFTCMATSFMKTKRFKQALQCCHEIITIPATVIKDEMTQAVRRAKILSLIVHSKPYEFPKHALRDLKDSWSRNENNPFIFRNNSFVDMNEAFKEMNTGRIDSVFAGNMVEFEKDDCAVLVPHVINAVNIQSIRNITLTYLSMSIEDIRSKARITSVAETEALLSQLILSGSIKAKINKRTGVVNFTDFDVSEREIDFDLLQDLAAKTETCLDSIAKIRKIQESHFTSQAYVKKHVHILKADGTPICELEKMSANMSGRHRGGAVDGGGGSGGGDAAQIGMDSDLHGGFDDGEISDE